MSAIKADAYDGEIKVYSVDETRALLGDSVSAFVTLLNSDHNSIGSDPLTFNYFDSFPASDIITGYGTDVSYQGNAVFSDYASVPQGHYLIYYAQIPEFVQDEIPSGAHFRVSLPLNMGFDDVSYIQFGCGFAYKNYSGDRAYTNTRPWNYMQVNGVAEHSVYRMPEYNDVYSWAQAGLKSIPDYLNDNEAVYPDVTLYYIQNTLDYEGESTSFSLGNVVCDDVHMYNSGKLFFCILCPIVNTGSSSDSTDRPIQNRDLKPIIQNTEDIKDLLEIIVSGSGASGLGKDDFVSLWVPSTAQLLTHEQSLRVMLHETFGSSYEAEELLQDAVDAIAAEDVEPLTHLDLPALSVPVDGQDIQIMAAQEVPLKPEGFDTLFTVIASIIDIICTFGIINMLRRRFEKGVLENEG